MSLRRLPKLDDLEEDKKEEKVKKVKKERFSIPKVEEDAEGWPALAIPDLDDVALRSEIDKYLGNFDGGEE